MLIIDISMAVPICNSLTFVFTALTAKFLGEDSGNVCKLFLGSSWSILTSEQTHILVFSVSLEVWLSVSAVTCEQIRASLEVLALKQYYMLQIQQGLFTCLRISTDG